MIPCKNCIAFAICIAKEDKITCSLLYEYFIEGGIPITNKDYPPTHLERLEEISTFFNKKVASWYFGSSGTFDSHNPNMTIHWTNLLCSECKGTGRDKYDETKKCSYCHYGIRT